MPTYPSGSSPWVARFLLGLMLMILPVPPAPAKSGKEARLQMGFGVQMARQGSWKEAQYRFQRALAESPADPEILNNLAVAYENNGRYPEAEKTYLQALEIDAGNDKIRSNYERFRVFYTRRLEALEKERQRREGGFEDAAEEPSGDEAADG